MAARFGGRHSPGGDPGDPPKWAGKAPSRAGAMVNALFIAPTPLVLMAFFRPPVEMMVSLVAWAVFMLAAWLTRDGVLAHEAFDARKVAKRPAFPRKLFGAGLTGVGLALAMSGAAGLPVAAFVGLIGAALHVLAFGPDPLRDKGVEGIDRFQADRVARVVDEAESLLKAMRDAIGRAGDRAAETRVDRFIATARDLCRTVEEDPRDLTSARKFLGVYLLGARDATAKFADIYARTRDAKARADYMALLDDLEQGFAQRTAKLLLEDRSDLEVEIEVLRDRLARDGLAPRS